MSRVAWSQDGIVESIRGKKRKGKSPCPRSVKAEGLAFVTTDNWLHRGLREWYGVRDIHVTESSAFLFPKTLTGVGFGVFSVR